MTTEQEIIAAINQVEHPEIAMSLVDLGMVRDIVVEEDGVTLTLVVPFAGIPESVRNYLLNSLYQAIVSQNSTFKKVYLAEMNEVERQEFLEKEHAHWRQ